MEYAYDKGRLAAISAFEQSSKNAATLDQLSALIDAIIGQFGFRWFALLHNVDLVRRSKKALMLTTYPARWLDEIIEHRLYLDDPVHAACAKTPSAAPNSLRAFRADMLAFDAWCRHRRARTLPAEAATVAAFLTARAGQGVLQRHWPGTKHRSPGYTVCAASQIRPRTNWSSSHWQLSAETRTSKGNDGTTGATSTHRS
jgi:hypothetical protein